MVHVCNSNIWETETRGFEIKASQGYIAKSSFKINNRKRKPNRARDTVKYIRLAPARSWVLRMLSL